MMEIEYKVRAIGKNRTSIDIERELYTMLDKGYKFIATVSGVIYNYMIFEKIK